MARTVKKAADRKREILETARRLFAAQGYEKTTVTDIIRALDIAKGTFYHHFASKKELLEEMVENEIEQIAAQAGQVVNDPALSALRKMELLLTGGRLGGGPAARELAEHLHQPANRELHELTNVRTVQRLAPLLALVVEQGVREGVFDVGQPLETVQILLGAAQFLLDDDLFDWSAAELTARRHALQRVVERALGARPGSFGFLASGGEA